MRKLVAIIVFCSTLLIGGCTDTDSSQRALRSLGFTNIQWTGYDFFGCSEDDFFHTGFTATNGNKKRVTGTVCCGLLFKNCTVRFE
tara:strand:+ start:504 stop:761 length:258 start_codon:yes stop_codon:yes gene_type:complete